MDRITAPTPAGWLDAPAGWTDLDPTSERLRRLVAGLPLGPVRDVLRGAQLGHPLHPALTQLPIGCWFSATALDLTGGQPVAARRLTALGLLAVPPTLWAGWVDWADLSAERRRTGLVHAASAVTATVLQLGSYRARRRGRTTAGVVLGLAGCTVLGVAAALGGHLAHPRSAAATATDPAATPDEPVPSETPGARMTDEGAPPPPDESRPSA
ncbi:DUF2231 domain-containing protein [Kitasatospora sp. NPDC101801]|uniref:DUF2231 domain-containing protein n=1 Tax=Kitasatospora sp. NPDC101801 TaxID=3364103 RepID=UPI0037F580B4